MGQVLGPPQRDLGIPWAADGSARQIRSNWAGFNAQQIRKSDSRDRDIPWVSAADNLSSNQPACADYYSAWVQKRARAVRGTRRAVRTVHGHGLSTSASGGSCRQGVSTCGKLAVMAADAAQGGSVSALYPLCIPQRSRGTRLRPGRLRSSPNKKRSKPQHATGGLF